MTTERRRFLATAGCAMATAAAAALADAPSVIAQPKVQWRIPIIISSGGEACAFDLRRPMG
jgi:hypothetical protein